MRLATLIKYSLIVHYSRLTATVSTVFSQSANAMANVLDYGSESLNIAYALLASIVRAIEKRSRAPAVSVVFPVLNSLTYTKPDRHSLY